MPSMFLKSAPYGDRDEVTYAETVFDGFKEIADSKPNIIKQQVINAAL